MTEPYPFSRGPRRALRLLGHATFSAAMLWGASSVGPVAAPSLAAAASPSATAAISPAIAPAVSLFGPFGRLDGSSGPAAASWPDGTTLLPLHAHGRGARLVAQPRDLDLAFLDWRLTARPALDDRAAVVELGRGPVSGGDTAYAVVDAPATGSWLLRLDATLDGTPAASWFWRLDVPDAEVPPPGEPFPPVPGIHLSSGDTGLDMTLGSGCFIGTCADLGVRPPVEGLPVLHVGAAAAPLTLSLGDGSGLSAWHLSVEPTAGGAAAPLADGAAAGPGQALIAFDGPASGRWLLEADLAFDLERGSYLAYAVLDVP
jgi:hypothetical protein